MHRRGTFPLLVGLGLAACNAPGPAFQGIDPHRIAVGGAVFDVRVDGRDAQAIRRNAEWAPRLAAVAPRGILAIEHVSGCRVARIAGDQAVMIAQLDCGTGAPPPPPPHLFDCALEDFHDGYGELTCVPRD